MKFLSMIYNRLYKYNQNFIAIVVGGTGTGKSYLAIRLAEIIDPEFNIDYIVFNGKQFQELLNSGKLKRGNIIVWDEAGVGMASREAMTKENRLIGKIAQTFRHQNLGLIFTVPDIGFVDMQIRKLAHVLLKPMKIDRYKKKVIVHVTKLQHNEKLKKTYLKPPRFIHDGKIITVDKLLISMPSKKIRRDYEDKKHAFTKELNKSAIYEKLDTEIKNVNTLMIAEEVVLKPEYIKTQSSGQKIVNWRLIKDDYNIGYDDAKIIKNRAERILNV